MYFEKFPTYEYDLKNTDKRTLITDLLRRVNLRSNVAANTLVFDEYNVADGESPDIVAAKYYGNSMYHWVVVTVNNVKSHYDWPLDQVALSQYVIDKYDNPDGTHHHEVSASSGDTTRKLTVSSDTAGAVAVTNYEYEQRLEDQKRQIKLLSPQYLSTFMNEFRKLIRR